MKREKRDRLKRLWARLFRFGQRFGVDVLPRHFYSEIPDYRRLLETDGWKKAYRLTGVRGTDLSSQLRFVRETVPPQLRARLAGGDVYDRACRLNGEPGFGPVEAEFLHAFVVTHRPRRVTQVGCGVSTMVMLEAAAEGDHAIEILCIDPYPTGPLRQLAERERIRLIARPVEDLDPSALGSLASGDLFFVDSSHALGPAGEASRLILEILPILPQGCRVHFHDIWFPYDYPPNLMQDQLFFQHESVLLHAFLAYNERFRILASMSMLHFRGGEALHEILPYTAAENDHGLQVGNRGVRPPSSIYLIVE